MRSLTSPTPYLCSIELACLFVRPTSTPTPLTRHSNGNNSTVRPHEASWSAHVHREFPLGMEATTGSQFRIKRTVCAITARSPPTPHQRDLADADAACPSAAMSRSIRAHVAERRPRACRELHIHLASTSDA